MMEKDDKTNFAMSHGKAEDELSLSIRRHMLFAIGLVAFLILGVGGWAALAKIAGAVVATGTVVVESNSKKIQHQEGGIVKTIHVRNGDTVAEGDLLIQLDTTVIRANLAVITKQLDELHAQKSRLIAEQYGRKNIDFSDYVVEDSRAASVADIRRNQIDLMVARQNSFEGRRKQLEEQITQFHKQIDGLKAQRNAKSEEMRWIGKELEGLESLFKKGLVTVNRVITLKRDRTRLDGEYGALVAQIAQVREAISERNIQILQIKEEFQARVLENLQDVRSRMARLDEEKIAADDHLTRVDVRSPRAGYIHHLSVHTIGGVIAPGEAIMMIVPHEDLLMIEAQIRPMDIEQLFSGQEATVRFSSFNQRTTPELKARLRGISADLTRDDITGLSYYLARLVVSEDEMVKLDGKRLIPGMPVEVFLRTESRTVLSYLLKPLSDQIAHAMKER